MKERKKELLKGPVNVTALRAKHRHTVTTIQTNPFSRRERENSIRPETGKPTHRRRHPTDPPSPLKENGKQADHSGLMTYTRLSVNLLSLLLLLLQETTTGC